MPKRRIAEPQEKVLFYNNEIPYIQNEESKSYRDVMEEEENLKNLHGEELVKATARVFVKRLILHTISLNIDAAVEEYNQNDGETQLDATELEAYRQAEDLLISIRPGNDFIFNNRFKNELALTEKNVRIFQEKMGTDEPLPTYFFPLATSEGVTDNTADSIVNAEKDGTLEEQVEEEFGIKERFRNPEEEIAEEAEEEKKEDNEEEKEEEKSDINQDAGNDDNGNNEDDNEEEKEEKLTEEQVNQRREEVNNSFTEFLRKFLESVDSLGVLKTIMLYADNLSNMIMFDGKTAGELFKDEVLTEDPVEREKQFDELIQKEIDKGEKQVSILQPEVLTDGKVVPGKPLVIQDSKQNLQELSDNYHTYEAVLDKHLLEFNSLKEEFGKTQDLPKANFDGKKQEGSDYYRDMTGKLQTCITMLEEMKSGKRSYSSDMIEGAYNAFKQSCETYFEKRKGTLFGPVTDSGKIRLGLSQNGSSKVDRMIKEVGAASEKIKSDVVVKEDGTTFNHLLVNEKKDYIKNLEEQGVVERKPERAIETQLATDELKTISTFDYSMLDYSGMKNGKYMDAAKNVILGRHFDIVNHGAAADFNDVNRIRNFETEVNNLAGNSAFRNMIDKEGVKETTKKWPEVEKNTTFLRQQIQENLNGLMVEKGNSPFTGEPYTENLTIDEYVAGITSKRYRADAKPDRLDAEEKLQSIANNPEELDKAYDRMTNVITSKLLLENDKFGKEFVNNMAANEKINDIAVYDQLKYVTKQLLVQNHVLEGKKISKALDQLESGKLGEDLVNSVKEVYKNEQKKRKETELNIKAEDLNVDKKLKDAGLTLTEGQYEKKQEVRATQNPYIQEGREELNKLSGMGKGFMKEGGEEVDQEKIQTIIKAVTAEYVFRNRDKFPTKESIDKMEKSFYQNKEAKAGILFLADQKTGAELADIIRTNSFSKELSGAMDKLKETAGKTFEPISKELREQRPDLVTKRYEEIKDAKNVLKVVDKSKEVKMPEHLKAEAPKTEKAAEAGGPKLG